MHKGQKNAGLLGHGKDLHLTLKVMDGYGRFWSRITWSNLHLQYILVKIKINIKIKMSLPFNLSANRSLPIIIYKI